MMASDGAKTRKRKSNSESELSPIIQSPVVDTIFALLLATLSKSDYRPDSISVVKKSLNKLRASLLSTVPFPPSLFFPIISLLPLLLSSRNREIARCGAKLVGLASLLSFEMNEVVASDGETVKELIPLLASLDRKVSTAACNAVLDLSTTSIGRQSLLQFSALETLMLAFLQVPRSTISISLCPGDEANITYLEIDCKEGEFLGLLLDATMFLTNTCETVELEKIPTKLLECFSAVLKQIWVKARSQMFLGNISRSCQEKGFHLTNMTINNLAESLFRLSINADQPTADSSPEMVRSSIFGSNEMDILGFLKEARTKLGCPLIYDQDIRVLRTEKKSKREVHFFPENLCSCSVETPCFFHVDDILKCDQAFKRGYTIALRGAEFRFESVASIADGLASLFGQPSVGANLYLTPPNSQGLSMHYDDHCVFVCQLLGKKHWKVFSQPIVQLPRLYASCDIPNSEHIESSTDSCRNLLLTEGDILYIPRGYPHEAYTDNNEVNGSAGFSLHVTLAIEVEPPFSWEGFAHVALCCWTQSQKPWQHTSSGSLSTVLSIMSIHLLHITIGLIGDSDPNFRKACLVAAIPSQSNTESWLYLNQRAIFSSVIDRINSASSMLEAVRTVEMASQKDEDPFQRMTWLKFLDWETEPRKDVIGFYPSQKVTIC
ncbi:uncharacterized protein LOC110809810 [Carica papaya]|uniref:uncharacterized protein LOC110809810 n=1 Tax=Carica papaya TaxID=3649 RepID=UPI000B8D0E0D|nr:uncharacterized protein LOC110809810 [Carica papaya]